MEVNKMELQDKQRLQNKYLGKKVRVIIDDPFRFVDEVGVVESVDDFGQLHGTWCGLAAIPGIDTIEILEG